MKKLYEIPKLHFKVLLADVFTASEAVILDDGNSLGQNDQTWLDY